MNAETRLSTYSENRGLNPLEGRQNLQKLTPAQQRRFLKKQKHAAKRGGSSADKRRDT